MKVISFSLFSPDGKGISEKYLKGIEGNWLAKIMLYPDWNMEVYHDHTVPKPYLEYMDQMGIRRILKETSRGTMEGMFWRFFPIADSKNEAVLVRDLDSRLNVRERAAVDEWMNSPSIFHVMRDHRQHKRPIMGGMWGCKRNSTIDFFEEYRRWCDFDHYGCDQDFLQICIWPSVKHLVMAHDGNPRWARKYAPDGLRSFPLHHPCECHVGQVCYE